MNQPKASGQNLILTKQANNMLSLSNLVYCFSEHDFDSKYVNQKINLNLHFIFNITYHIWVLRVELALKLVNHVFDGSVTLGPFIRGKVRRLFSV